MGKLLNAFKILGLCLAAPVLLVGWAVIFFWHQMKMIVMPDYWTTGQWKAEKIFIFGTACGILGILTCIAILIVLVVHRFSIDRFPEGTSPRGFLISAVIPYLIAVASAALPLTVLTMFSMDESPNKGPIKLWWWIVGWMLLAIGYAAFLFASWRLPLIYGSAT